MNQNIFASETLFSAAYLNIEQTTDIFTSLSPFLSARSDCSSCFVVGTATGKPDGVSREASNPV